MADDFTALRGGQINAAGDDRALYLKVYANEVLRQFQNNTVMFSKHMIRSINSGKSAQFPVLGILTASYHTPGTTILGQTANANEKVIAIDSKLIAPFFIPDVDEAMSHYDIRGPFAQEAGEALSQQFDKRTMQVIILAARTATPNVTGGNVGSSVVNATADTVAADLKSALLTAAKTLDEKNIPSTQRYGILRPAQYYLLVGDAISTSVLNRDVGGVGNIANADLPRFAGIDLYKSNNIPNGVVAADATNEKNTYAGDFTETICPIFHYSAMGTVKLIDLQTESEYSARHQGTLVLSKYLMGHGILRPESAYEIKNA